MAEMSADRLNVSVSDGRYTIIQKQDGSCRLLRHGEDWPAYPAGQSIPNIVLALGYEVQALRDKLKVAGVDG
ncbi:hypothetical protein NKJ09_23320 [Mesorhizobium sp. M0189]|uniref:hypothetical protein n=1 Tax=Mesorhizobium sp. M0189 TaxID=2956909 RepID=UPI00333E0F59